MFIRARQYYLTALKTIYLDLRSFAFRQKPKRLHTFSNIMTCANASVQDLISLLLKHFFLVLKVNLKWSLRKLIPSLWNETI